ncbi:hypothetical protein BST86_08585 [Nonlabens agnitus]|uniref:Uncharacterized protein n=1 Tax=Nonlabens agnitus TaxID=870484 RepID=A0A2S9WUL3_9FLAO|nr:hypothetical protein BST86_08585 [Nonlabens agnitus]
MTISWKHIMLGIGIVIIDLTVYILLGLLLMNYDDFYTESEGEYWSLASMTTTEKITYIGLNAWHVINILGIVYIIYRLTRKLKKHWWQQRI